MLPLGCCPAKSAASDAPDLCQNTDLLRAFFKLCSEVEQEVEEVQLGFRKTWYFILPNLHQHRH